MKTYSRLRLSLVAIGLLLLIGTTPVQAQDRGHGEKGRSEARGGGRGHFERGTYYRRAPWGLHRPYSLYHNHARVYYYGGNYWQYYPNRGYSIYDLPGDYYFDEVPAGFRRVWIDGRWCYRRGDLYLRPGVHGYVAFPGPGVRIGVGF
jgi:hypothetical protein